MGWVLPGRPNLRIMARTVSDWAPIVSEQSAAPAMPAAKPAV